jgi:hypothetical protein
MSSVRELLNIRYPIVQSGGWTASRGPSSRRRRSKEEIWTAAKRVDGGDYYPMYAGQSVGVIHDLPGAGEVVARIMEEARAAARNVTALSQGR